MYFGYFLVISPWHGSSFEQTWIPFTQRCFVSSLVEIGPVVLEKIFKFFMYFCYFVFISPWKRAWLFILTNLNPLTQGCFVPSSVEIGLVVIEKKIFKFCQCIFAILYSSLLGKGVAFFILTNLNPLTQGCFVPCSVEIGPVVIEKKIFKFCQCIFAIS